MTEDLTGWHPDPTGRHEHRYFDGSEWTDHVADGGTLSTDPVAAPAEASRPAEPSRVDLPAITPELLAGLSATGPGAGTAPQPAPTPPSPGPMPTPAPTPVATSTPVSASDPTATHPAPAGHDDDAIDNQAIAAAMTLPSSRPTLLAALLSVIVPGTGHLYLGVKREIGIGLVVATVVALVLAYSLDPWFIGLIVYLAAAVFALRDLMPTLQPAMQSRGGGLDALGEVGSGWGWRLVGLGGIALVFALFLPWFRIKSEIGGIGAAANASGFDALELIDLLSLVTGGLAIVAAVIALGVIRGKSLPDALPLVLAVAGAACFVLIAFRLLFPGAGDLEGIDIQRAPGIFLAAASALTIAFGAASALKSEH